MKVTTTRHLLRGGTLLAAGFVLAAAPVQMRFDSGPGIVALGWPAAQAKDGRDDDRGDRSGSGREDRSDDSSDDRGRDDSSDDRNDDRGRDDRSDDHSGRGRGDRSDDRSDDRGREDRSEDRNEGRGGDDSHEVRLDDGSRIEVENGRFERKDASGRTIEERPATAADLALVGRMASRAAQTLTVDRRRARGGGIVAKLEVSGGNIEITYDDGWKEEIENGVYELKDGLGRTVIERPAKQADTTRLFSAVR